MAKIPDKLTVLVDTREKKPLLFPGYLRVRDLGQLLKRRSQSQLIEVTTAPKKLVRGDYALRNYELQCVVERKGSIGELIANTSEGDKTRFLDAFKRFSEVERPLLLLDCLPASVFNPPQSCKVDPMKAIDAILGLCAHCHVDILWGSKSTTSVSIRRKLGELVLRAMIHRVDFSKPDV